MTGVARCRIAFTTWVPPARSYFHEPLGSEGEEEASPEGMFSG